MKLPDWAAKRLGPFPIAGWVGIVGAGVGIAYVVNRGKGRQALAQNPNSVQPVAFDQSATPALEGSGGGGGGTVDGGQVLGWVDVLDAYREGLADAAKEPVVLQYEDGSSFPDSSAQLVMPSSTTQPASWDTPTVTPQPGTSAPMIATPIPTREPVYAPAGFYDAVTAPRLDNPTEPASHTNPILRAGDAPSPGSYDREGGTLAQIAAASAQYAPSIPTRNAPLPLSSWGAGPADASNPAWSAWAAQQ